MQKLFIISNESIFMKMIMIFFCDNIDLKSTPEGLNNNFEVNLIARKSNKLRNELLKNIKLNHQINLNKIKNIKVI